MKISAIVLTKNEEKNINDSLESISFCDEVIVVDDNSSDKTVDIAKKHGAKVIKRALGGNFADQRNFALSIARCDWVLFIDADERVSEKLTDEIKVAVKSDEFKGYFFKRTDFMWGQAIKHGEIGSIKILRLAKKGFGKWERGVHEKWIINGKISDFIYPIVHYPHNNLSDFIEHIDYFSGLHADANFKEGKK